MTLAARARSRPFLAGLVCGGAHAACYALMFPPVFLWGLALVALAPLMWLCGALGGEERHQGIEASRDRVAGAPPRRMMRRALLGVYLAVMPMWAFHHLWIAKVTPVGFPVLILYLSVYAPLFVWLGARWRRWVDVGRIRKGVAPRGWLDWRFGGALPVIWVGLEMLRGAVVWDGYAWFFVGHPLIAFPGVAGFGKWIGASGVSWFIAGFSEAMIVNAVAWPRWKKQMRWCMVGVVLLAGAGLALWSLLARLAGLGAGADAPQATIAVVQTNVPQDNKVAWRFEQRRTDFERFKAMTRDLAGGAEKPDVIAWPETMFPGVALNDDAVRVERGARLTFADKVAGAGVPSTMFYDELLALQKEIRIPMVVGAIAKDGLRIDTIEGPDGRRHVEFDASATFNSAFVIADGIVLPERYDKMKLTPFGEYMPYISWSEWLEKKLLALGAGGMRFDLGAGRTCQELSVPRVAPNQPEPPHPSSPEAGDATLAHQGRGEITNQEKAAAGAGNGAGALRVATPICFEATAAGVCRRLVFEGGWGARRKADVILNLTNDGWFADSPGAHENHLLLARWRCVELATPMVRAANTGISCAIDASGRVMERLGKRTEGVLRAAVALPAGGPTTYARTGDVAGWACLGLTGLMAGVTLVNAGAGRRRKGKVGSAAEGHNAPDTPDTPDPRNASDAPAGAQGAKR